MIEKIFTIPETILSPKKRLQDSHPEVFITQTKSKSWTRATRSTKSTTT